MVCDVHRPEFARSSIADASGMMLSKSRKLWRRPAFPPFSASASIEFARSGTSAALRAGFEKRAKANVSVVSREYINEIYVEARKMIFTIKAAKQTVEVNGAPVIIWRAPQLGEGRERGEVQDVIGLGVPEGRKSIHMRACDSQKHIDGLLKFQSGTQQVKRK